MAPNSTLNPQAAEFVPAALRTSNLEAEAANAPRKSQKAHSEAPLHRRTRTEILRCGRNKDAPLHRPRMVADFADRAAYLPPHVAGLPINQTMLRTSVELAGSSERELQLGIEEYCASGELLVDLYPLRGARSHGTGMME
ncbi:hypothetical protein H2199_002925 [Coniosporium tulheliwenetii]|uniref:Uncharacterized protein n=1 Tax=Coniosporium tulheliwenetii TaxID=3383036 RepID=A0ACC2ZDJ4_9PEZI|nr:hypothetical protein H2199_002925 [Cladosporium sp. JES 115]